MSRKLAMIGVEPELIQVLTRNKLGTIKDILSRTEIELMQILDLSLDSISELVQKCSLSVAPQSSTVLEILNKKNSKPFIYLPTTLFTLDKFLSGGVPACSITEIVGPAGVGKTQFCLMLSLLTTLPQEMDGLNGNVLYFDTESSFSADRLAQIAVHRYPDYFSGENGEAHIAEVLSKITIFTMKNSLELIDKLKLLEEILIEKNVKLIILDSVASAVRKDFDSGNMIGRQSLLSKQASILKYLAESFEIPVVVVNQITAKYENLSIGNVPGSISYNDKKSFLAPALGTVWFHSVNTRLVLEFRHEERWLTIAKSPISPVVRIPYQIDDSGLQQIMGESNSEIIEAEPSNYWDQRIQNKEAAPGMRTESQHHTAISHQEYRMDVT